MIGLEIMDFSLIGITDHLERNIPRERDMVRDKVLASKEILSLERKSNLSDIDRHLTLSFLPLE